MAAPGFAIAAHPAPFDYAAVITTSDTVNLAQVTNGIYVGGTGTLTALLQDGNTVLISGIPAGAVLPIRAVRVNATGTTATLIVGLW